VEAKRTVRARVSYPQFETYDNLSTLRERAKEETAKVVIGQETSVELMLVAAIAHGHVLLEGPPGSAKTLLGRAMAHVLGASFKRIQFTSDTTPTDILGRTVMRAGEAVFLPGPLFSNVILADEINRTPPKTQAALLEAMQERHVTVEGKLHRLPDPFLVIATQNPYEQEGVYILPESQLDRFLFKIELDFAGRDDEVEMLRLPHTGVTPDMLGEIRPLLGKVGLDRARSELDSTEAPDEVLKYVIALARRTRTLPGVILGASSRAAIHLLGAAKAHARLQGRSFVMVEDVQAMAPFVLRHRLILEPGAEADEVLRRALSAVPV
jgi:MoxR-like ATPase